MWSTKYNLYIWFSMQGQHYILTSIERPFFPRRRRP
mgnify:CR=1 FL=1